MSGKPEMANEISFSSTGSTASNLEEESNAFSTLLFDEVDRDIKNQCEFEQFLKNSLQEIHPCSSYDISAYYSQFDGGREQHQQQQPLSTSQEIAADLSNQMYDSFYAADNTCTSQDVEGSSGRHEWQTVAMAWEGGEGCHEAYEQPSRVYSKEGGPSSSLIHATSLAATAGDSGSDVGVSMTVAAANDSIPTMGDSLPRETTSKPISSSSSTSTSKHSAKSEAFPGSDTMFMKQIMQIPSNIVEAFNIGDLDSLFDIINRYCTEDCLFKGPVSDQEYRGRPAIHAFFKSVSDDFPDGVLVAKDTAMVSRYQLKFKSYFNGTKEKLYEDGQELPPYALGTYVQHVNIAKYTESELQELVAHERSLKEKRAPVEVVAKTETKLTFNSSYSIIRYEVSYILTAFGSAGK